MRSHDSCSGPARRPPCRSYFSSLAKPGGFGLLARRFRGCWGWRSHKGRTRRRLRRRRVLPLPPHRWPSGALMGITFPRRLLTGLLAFNAGRCCWGEIGGFYVTVWWWDILLHLVASAVLSVFGMALAMSADDGSPGRIGARMLAILASASRLWVGAMWEVLEFSLDATLGTVTGSGRVCRTPWATPAANVVGAFAGARRGACRMSHGQSAGPYARVLKTFMDQNPALYSWRRPGRRVSPLKSRPPLPAVAGRPVRTWSPASINVYASVWPSAAVRAPPAGVCANVADRSRRSRAGGMVAGARRAYGR